MLNADEAGAGRLGVEAEAVAGGVDQLGLGLNPRLRSNVDPKRDLPEYKRDSLAVGKKLHG